MIDKKLLQELKQKLEKEKTAIEKELETFAKKDKKLKGIGTPVFQNGTTTQAAARIWKLRRMKLKNIPLFCLLNTAWN